MKPRFLLLALFLISLPVLAQDSTVMVGEKVITLSPVVVSKGMNVPLFIQKIREDSSFYKAFKNLHILNYTAHNDVRMLNKKGNTAATLMSSTRQHSKNGCRTMDVLQESVTGNFYEADGSYHYYTAKMYADLFFTKGSICGETNHVGNMDFDVSRKSGLEKHKAQLKMLFFNPGKKIPGLPFMASKTPIYDDVLAGDYEMRVDYGQINNTDCIIFHQQAKEGREKHTVIDEMTTWFDEQNMQVIARKYVLNYKTMVYNFNVLMEVEMAKVGDLTVPNLIRYNGDWKIVGQERERGVFTATLSNFSR